MLSIEPADGQEGAWKRYLRQGRMEVGTQTTGLAARAAVLSWYHTIELPGGVRTAGFYDTVAGLRRFPFPASLAGKRCLDVGTSDGFWAFEMERRGAAEVVACAWARCRPHPSLTAPGEA